MSVPATPSTGASPVTADQIRMFLRDYALGHLPGGQGNILLDDVQFTVDEIQFATDMAVEAYNAVTPMTAIAAAQFPNKYVLLIGVARFLLMTESFHQLRNQVQAQDGNVSPTGIYEKTSGYAGLSQALQGEWQQLVRGIKTQQNMETAFGTFGSGYSSLKPKIG